MEFLDLNVEPRTETGKGPARRLRRQGRIPAQVYRGGEQPLGISLEPVDFELKLRKADNRNVLIRIRMEGEERVCILKEVQRHPVRRQLLHVDLYEVKLDEPIEVRVRLETEGRAEGELLGGRLRVMRRWLRVRCLPQLIPDRLVVDVSPLEINDFVHVADIPTPEGVELVYDQNFNVLGVVGRSAIEEELEAEEEAEAAAAAEALEGEEPVASEDQPEAD